MLTPGDYKLDLEVVAEVLKQQGWFHTKSLQNSGGVVKPIFLPWRPFGAKYQKPLIMVDY